MEMFRVERQDTVAVMTWCHEEQNRFTTDFLTAVSAGLAELERDPTVRGVVVTGAQEKYFSTGIHLEWLLGESAKDTARAVEFMHALNRLLIQTTEFPKPLVAAINGHVAAGGAILASCFDYRLMVQDRGLILFPEVNLNIPFWPGMLAICAAIVPPATFRDLAFTGDRFTSAQGKAMGYIDELLPADRLLPRAIELAAKLGRGQLETYAATKRLLRAEVLRKMREEDPAAIREQAARFGAKV